MSKNDAANLDAPGRVDDGHTAQEKALVAMYLSMGFLAAKKGYEDFECVGGELGALSIVADFVPVVHAVEVLATQHELEFPGVFHYEVIEPMGQWLRLNPEMKHKAFMDALAKEVNGFFEQDCSNILTAVIGKLPPGYPLHNYEPPVWQAKPENDSPEP